MTKNFFNISDLTYDQLLEILSDDQSLRILENKNIGMIFEKYSTRTRLSFSVGIHDLGGNTIDIKFDELNISRDESFEDTFKAMDCYLDGLIYRTNNHEKLALASRFFTKPIINALSDLSHPCQILSDLLTLKEHFGTLNFQILWMGDMNNVCFSLVEAAQLIKQMNLIICTPSYISKKIDWKLSDNISIVSKLDKTNLSNINCVMTDVFLSMNDENDNHKVSLLKPYIVNSDLMSKLAPNSIFMHCLPAKVGFEVSEEVFKSPRSIVWKQAFNRMIAQKKLLKYIFQ